MKHDPVYPPAAAAQLEPLEMSDKLRDAVISIRIREVFGEDTELHLAWWLFHCVDQGEQLQAKIDIMRALTDDPTLIERNCTWSEIRERGRDASG